MAFNIQFLHYCLEQKGKKTKKGYYQACIQCIKMQESKSRAWCKTIVTTSFYIRSYNSFAPSPRNIIGLCTTVPSLLKVSYLTIPQTQN